MAKRSETFDGFDSAVTITRPANTTPYSAGDVVGNATTAIQEFANIGPAGGYIVIKSADLRIDVAAIPAGMTTFRLHLYDVSPTAIIDNAAWDLPAADRASYIGYIDHGTVLDLGSTLYVQANSINKQFKLASGSTSLFGQLVTNGGYTPGSADVAVIRLTVEAI